jgi:hypothetical protein
VDGASRSAALGRLDVLVGEWAVEADSPVLRRTMAGFACSSGCSPDSSWSTAPPYRSRMRRTAWRSSASTPETGAYRPHYYDSRGVARLYSMTLDDGVWRLLRDAPDFSELSFCQRFTGVLDEAGSVIRGRCETSNDSQSWVHDLTLTYRRISR